MADFDEFMKQFLTAVKENDSEFLKGVYSQGIQGTDLYANAATRAFFLINVFYHESDLPIP